MSLTYKIVFSREAKKQLKRLDKNTSIRIIQSIETLKNSPRKHKSSKKLKGYQGEFYRLRIGQFRVIYEILDEKVIVIIIRIKPRGDVYKI